MFRLITILFCFTALTACNTFEENLREDQESTTTMGMNAKQEAAVDDFAAGGQLTPEEKRLMDESISGAGSPAGEVNQPISR